MHQQLLSNIRIIRARELAELQLQIAFIDELMALAAKVEAAVEVSPDLAGLATYKAYKTVMDQAIRVAEDDTDVLTRKGVDLVKKKAEAVLARVPDLAEVIE